MIDVRPLMALSGVLTCRWAVTRSEVKRPSARIRLWVEGDDLVPATPGWRPVDTLGQMVDVLLAWPMVDELVTRTDYSVAYSQAAQPRHVDGQRIVGGDLGAVRPDHRRSVDRRPVDPEAVAHDADTAHDRGVGKACVLHRMHPRARTCFRCAGPDRPDRHNPRGATRRRSWSGPAALGYAWASSRERAVTCRDASRERSLSARVHHA